MGGKTCLEEMITQHPNMVITLMLRFMQLQYITHSLNILKKKKKKHNKGSEISKLNLYFLMAFVVCSYLASKVSKPLLLCPPVLLWTLSYQVRCHLQYISDAASLQPCSSLDTSVLELLAILWCWTKIWSLHAGLIKHRHDSHVEQFPFWSKFWHLHQVAGVRDWKSLIFLTGQPLYLVKTDRQSHTKYAPDVLPRT